MTDSDWEQVESELLDTLDSFGIFGMCPDRTEELLSRFINALRKDYRKAEAEDGTDD